MKNEARGQINGVKRSDAKCLKCLLTLGMKDEGGSILG